MKDLWTENFIEFLIKEYDGEMYLPCNYTNRTSKWGWVVYCSSIYLLLGNTLQYDKFKSMIRKVLKESESSMLHKNLVLDINPHITKVLKSSKMKTCSIYRLYNLYSWIWQDSSLAEGKHPLWIEEDKGWRRKAEGIWHLFHIYIKNWWLERRVRFKTAKDRKSLQRIRLFLVICMRRTS